MQMEHPSKTHLNMLKSMYEISTVNAAKSREQNGYQTEYGGAPYKVIEAVPST